MTERRDTETQEEVNETQYRRHKHCQKKKNLPTKEHSGSASVIDTGPLKEGWRSLNQLIPGISIIRQNVIAGSVLMHLYIYF